MDVLMFTYNFIKYENTFFKNKLYFISTNTYFQNKAGQRANTLILGCD